MKPSNLLTTYRIKAKDIQTEVRQIQIDGSATHMDGFQKRCAGKRGPDTQLPSGWFC